MPVVTGPDGRKLRFPDGTSEQEVMAVLQQQYPDAFGGAPAGPDPAQQAAPGAASPALPGPYQPGVAPGAAGGIPQDDPGALSVDPNMAPDPAIQRQYEETKQNRANVADMGGLQKFLAGAGESVYSTGKGIQQLYNMATGDKEKLAQLQAEELERRFRDQALTETGAAKAGQIGGYAAQAYLPAGAASKGASLATMAAPRGAQLAAQVGSEAAIGSALGGAQPTAPGESHRDNAERGAMVGAAGRLAPAAVGAGANLALAKTGISPFIDALKRAGRNMEGGSENAARRAAGERMGQVMSRVNIPANPLAKDLARIGRRYQRDLPDSVLFQIQELGRYGGNAKLKGPAVAEMRTALNREAQASEGIRRSGLESIARTLDEHVENQMTRAQVKALRQARTEYRTGRPQPGMSKATPFALGVNSTLRDDID